MNEVVIPITPIMKLKAFNQATFMKNRSGNKIQQYGKDYTNSAEAQSFNNTIVGELGELAFREYLKNNNFHKVNPQNLILELKKTRVEMWYKSCKTVPTMLQT